MALKKFSYHLIQILFPFLTRINVKYFYFLDGAHIRDFSDENFLSSSLACSTV